jgi:hypothetical protein
MRTAEIVAHKLSGTTRLWLCIMLAHVAATILGGLYLERHPVEIGIWAFMAVGFDVIGTFLLAKDIPNFTQNFGNDGFGNTFVKIVWLMAPVFLAHMGAADYEFILMAWSLAPQIVFAFCTGKVFPAKTPAFA